MEQSGYNILQVLNYSGGSVTNENIPKHKGFMIAQYSTANKNISCHVKQTDQTISNQIILHFKEKTQIFNFRLHEINNGTSGIDFIFFN